MNIKRIIICACACVLPFAGAAAQALYSFGKGTLSVTPLDSRSVRVRYWETPVQGIMPEWIYLEGQTPAPQSAIKVEVDSEAQTLKIYNAAGEAVFTATGHELVPAPLEGMPLYRATLTADSPADEYIFGLGQFQDGFVNVRGLSRRLTQVNTQIALPMYISSKGYGLLWNNYGIVEFNPCPNKTPLRRTGLEGSEETVNVTSSLGGVQERRTSNVFEARIDVAESGEYAVLLDVGQKMARRHNLSIDGVQILDQRNLWLPPTASSIVYLEKGSHNVRAELESNDSPVLEWRKTDNSTTLSSEVAECVDYTVFVGDASEVVASYRALTGEVPMMPRWALGYIHCRERYHSQEELLSNATEFRSREIPIDVIVQDWQYWGSLGWNAMDFDRANYPDPRAMTDSLHAMDMRLMLSVWSKIDPTSTVGASLKEQGYLIDGTDWIDFFNPDAASEYWRNFSARLLPYGIDCWWLDATEPENDDLTGRRIAGGSYPGELLRNCYSLPVSRTVYEGLMEAQPELRPMIFTRNAFPGIQRYATCTWSGDVGWDWQTLRYQLSSGLGMMAAGQAWWTYDAGGFFRPRDQYSNPAYIECMLRWIEASVFLPLMRVHGYMSDTEPWRYGERALEIIRSNIELRYTLLPYIYSEAAAVSFEGGTLMRPLVFDFAGDRAALEQRTQYMFGRSLLVCPVTEPGVSHMVCYLPENEAGWFDFRSGAHYSGGAETRVVVDESFIPVFVRGGSMVPMDEDGCLRVLVAPGADAEFCLYEDDGVSNAYLRGECVSIRLSWDDASRSLHISAPQGGFEGFKAARRIDVRVLGMGRGSVDYAGSDISVNF